MQKMNDVDVFLDEMDRLGTLPSPPAVAVEVLRLSRSPSASLRDVAAVIGKDPALTGKLLKTVNSALFGIATHVKSVEQAAVILGLRSIRMLALGFSLVSGVLRSRYKDFDYRYYWRNAFTAAVSARMLASLGDTKLADEAYLCGLLQDIGVLVLQQCAPQRYEQVLKAKNASSATLAELETEAFGFSHQDLSGALLDRWGLPELLVQAVANHHRPEQLQGQQPVGQLAAVLHVAALISQLFCDPRKSVTLARVYAATSEHLDLSQEQMHKVLTDVQGRVRENAALFNLDIGEPESFQDIQQQARLELARLGLEAQRDLQQTAWRHVELLEEKARLQGRSLTDHLTGLANRAALDERLTEHLQRRDSQPNVSLLLVDIDNFKRINDTFGHSVGDKLLTAVAKVIADQARSHDLVARYGGDEFVVVLPGAHIEQAVPVGERIRLAVQKGSLRPDFPARVTVSIGAACLSDLAGNATAQDLIEQADRRMYAAKRAGRNCTMPALQEKLVSLQD